MTTSPVRQEFSVRAAIEALLAEGVIESVLLPGPRGLVREEPAVAAQRTEAAFLGARLDSRLLQERELFVALSGEQTHGRRFAGPWLARGGWVLTDVSAGDEPLAGAACPAVGGALLCNDPVRALAVLARVWREAMPVRVAAVTGTNGKTTTKDFLAALLTGAGSTLATAGNFNNALGLPVTLLGLRPRHRFAVIEMGASACGEIDYLAALAQPEVGVITNAAPAHLAEFGSLENIIKGKGELLDHLPPNGVAVLNADSPGWLEWRERARCAVESLGTTTGGHHWSYAMAAAQPMLSLDGADWPVPLPGAHNAGNLAAAILAARALGATTAEIRTGLASFSGSAHRGVVSTVGGRVVLDDCYNANPTSMMAAAQALLGLAGSAAPGRTIAVLGHMAELGDAATEIHRQTGRDLAGTGLDVLVAVGEDARPLGVGFDAATGGGHYCATVAEAARWLGAGTRAGDHILIKGSRSAAMEEILPLLAVAFGDGGDSPD